LSEATSLPEKKKRKENQNPESKDSKPKDLKSKDSKSKDLESRESCWNIMNFFKLLEEMETKKISEKSGKSNCKGPVGSRIEYSYHIKINDPARREEMPRKPVS